MKSLKGFIGKVLFVLRVYKSTNFNVTARFIRQIIQARIIRFKFLLIKYGVIPAYPSLKPFLNTFSEENKLIDHIRTNMSCFFIPMAKEIHQIKNNHPDYVNRIISQANRILDNTYSFLGSGDITFRQGNLPWHTDIKSGYHWDKKTFYKKIRYGHIEGADVKVPWEMSRLQMLPILSLAYLFTDEDIYVRKFMEIFRNWVDENPPYQGVNWACTMDVAIRMVNMTVGFLNILNSKAVTDDDIRIFLKVHLQHARHIRTNLEWSPFLTSNHYMANICGLFAACLPFEKFPEYKRYLNFCRREMETEIFKQFRNDGTNFESSTYYHAFVTEMLLYPYVFSRIKGGITFSPAFEERLKKACFVIREITTPAQRIPQIGDTDSGKFLCFDSRDILDYTHIITHAAVLFPDFHLPENLHPSPEVHLFYDKEHITSAIMRRQSAEASLISFNEGGLHIYRDPNMYFIFYATPQGTDGIGNHNHNDKLSFILFVYGQEIVTDPGTYVYTPYPKWRNTFRSTRYHNTVMVNKEEQCRFVDWSLFYTVNDAEVSSKAENKKNLILFKGKHTGYKRIGIIHERTVKLSPGDMRLEIEDSLTPVEESKNPKIAASIFLHLHPAVQAEQHGSEINLYCNHVLSRVEVHCKNVKIIQSWHSPEYGLKESSSAIECRLHDTLPITHRMILSFSRRSI